jgi:MFS family permease
VLRDSGKTLPLELVPIARHSAYSVRISPSRPDGQTTAMGYSLCNVALQLDRVVAARRERTLVPRTRPRLSGWSRAGLAIVLAHAVLIQIVTFCLRPSLSYAALESGLGVEWLGALSAAFALPGLALAIPAGRLADRLGERVIAVVGGVLLFAGTAVALVLPGSIAALIGATVLFGCGHLLSVIADQTLLANRTKAVRRDSVFGGYAFTVSLGQGIGGALLAINAGDSATPDLDLQFLLSVSLAAVLLLCAALMRRTPPKPLATGAVALPPTPLVEMLRRPRVLRAIAASALVVTAVEISLVYFPALGYERGFSAAVVSAMLVGRSIASMASRLGMGLWIRLIGRRRLMVGSVGLSAVALAALALPLDPVGTIALCAAFGLFNGFSQPLTLSWLSEIAPHGERGTIMSARIAAVRISQTALPMGVGALSGALGAGGVLVVVGAIVGVAAWMSAAIGEHPRADPEPPPTPAPEPGPSPA